MGSVRESRRCPRCCSRTVFFSPPPFAPFRTPRQRCPQAPQLAHNSLNPRPAAGGDYRGTGVNAAVVAGGCGPDPFDFRSAQSRARGVPAPDLRSSHERRAGQRRRWHGAPPARREARPRHQCWRHQVQARRDARPEMRRLQPVVVAGPLPRVQERARRAVLCDGPPEERVRPIAPMDRAHSLRHVRVRVAGDPERTIGVQRGRRRAPLYGHVPLDVRDHLFHGPISLRHVLEEVRDVQLRAREVRLPRLQSRGMLHPPWHVPPHHYPEHPWDLRNEPLDS